MATLHADILESAPLGYARRDCPGAFEAHTAKRPDGTCLVRYVGKADHPRHFAAISVELARFLNTGD